MTDRERVSSAAAETAFGAPVLVDRLQALGAELRTVTMQSDATLETYELEQPSTRRRGGS